MSRYTDLEISQQVTDATVASEGELITLLRKAAPVPDGAGGYLDSTDDWVPQPARRRVVTGATLSVRSGNTREFVQDATGERYEIKYVIIGNADDDMQRGDRFTYRGEKMVIIDVHPDRTYEVRGQVVGWSDGMR